MDGAGAQLLQRRVMGLGAAAHNEAIALRTSVLRLMEMRKAVDAVNNTDRKSVV